jgi:hypothetical protein
LSSAFALTLRSSPHYASAPTDGASVVIPLFKFPHVGEEVLDGCLAMQFHDCDLGQHETGVPHQTGGQIIDFVSQSLAKVYDFLFINIGFHWNFLLFDFSAIALISFLFF